MDIDTSDDSFDLSLEGMQASAGSQNSNSGAEGSANNVLDGLPKTIWHTKYGGTSITDNWINIHLDNKQVVNGLRYLPRQDGGSNGTFLEYEIYVSDDNGQTYSKINSGSWKSNFKWQIAKFDAREVTDVKLQPIKTTTSSTKEYGSAAEIRLFYMNDNQVNKDKLEELIKQCDIIDKNDYLNRNWDKFEKALTSTKNSCLNPNITQGEVNDLFNRLSSVFNSLEKKPTIDNPIIKPLDAKAGSSYGSNQNPINVINGVGLSGNGTLQDKHDNEKSAKTMWHTSANPGNRAWFEVDLGDVYELDEMWIWNINQINNVERGFKNVKIEYSLDEEKWLELTPEENMEFLSEGTEDYPFQFSIASGDSLISATNLNDRDHSPVKFNGIEAQYIKITAAPIAGEGSWGQNYFGLSELRFTRYFKADKSELQELYNESLVLNEANYTSESWVTFANAMTDAKAVLDRADASQEEVNNVKTILQNAKNALVEVVIKTNKTALEIAIEMAESANLENIVPAVVEEFNAALENAQTVYTNANATQEEVDNAFTRLANVMHMLEFFKGNKELLQKQVDQINGLEADKYIESTWNAMLPVLANVNAMQEEVDEVYSELVRAFVNLRLKPNKDILADLINKANGLNRENYSEASLKGLDAKVEKAKTVLNNPKASQEEVEAAAAELTKVLAGLEAKPVETVKPVDTTVSVKTGDDGLLGIFTSLSVLSIAGLSLFKKRRLNREQDLMNTENSN
ncbi:discoidin domain-containing protein [Thomasclavelia cocleata]|uniref:discoidin domain-containing protein n=1 Tax=Thomasclavelia cocleata TaxID=69824 RepID=UPI0025906FA2|nr:discoidin domain-containing protein [Thomasclavelia cocleata]